MQTAIEISLGYVALSILCVGLWIGFIEVGKRVAGAEQPPLGG